MGHILSPSLALPQRICALSIRAMVWSWYGTEERSYCLSPGSGLPHGSTQRPWRAQENIFGRRPGPCPRACSHHVRDVYRTLSTSTDAGLLYPKQAPTSSRWSCMSSHPPPLLHSQYHTGRHTHLARDVQLHATVGRIVPCQCGGSRPAVRSASMESGIACRAKILASKTREENTGAGHPRPGIRTSIS